MQRLDAWCRYASLALVVLGCAEATAPVPLPEGAREFTPEPVFREWWAQMEICSSERASFDAVRWFVVPGETPFRVRGVAHPVVGYWDPQGNSIVLLQFLPDQRAPVIRHEALHAIIRRTDHPAVFFEERCAATIGGPDSPD